MLAPPTVPTSRPSNPSWRDDRFLGLALALAAAAFALAIGLLLPASVLLPFIEENGPLESATIVVYLLAVLELILLRVKSLTAADQIALGTLLLAFAAREADLHKAMFGISILKASFYLHVGTAGQIVAAIGVLAPVVAALLWLVVRHGRRWMAGPGRWSGAVATAVVFAATMVISKAFDRLPDTLLATGLAAELPLRLSHLLSAEEEVLEMALPLLAMLGIAQATADRGPSVG